MRTEPSEGAVQDEFSEQLQYQVISREITPLAALYPPPIKKLCFLRLQYRASLSISALIGHGGGMHINIKFQGILPSTKA